MCWVSAKAAEFVEGKTRGRTADFSDKEGVIAAIWQTLYETDDVISGLDGNALLNELKTLPTLLVVDDFDTVMEDEDLSEFLLHDLRGTKTRVIYTSRHLVQGMRRIEVGPFSDPDLDRFVRQRCAEYGADPTKCVIRLSGIRSVTSGYPLFVDDLIHHAAIIGVDRAMEDWSKRRGDAAREYALRRQVEHLGQSCDDVLIALATASRPLSTADLARVAGLTNQDAESGVRELLRWRMVNQSIDEGSGPAYRMNLNSSRLVTQTYRDDKRLRSASEAVKALVGERVPEGKRRAVGRVISQTKELLRRRSLDDAIIYLEASMVGELDDSPDLFGVLGWLRSKEGGKIAIELGRSAFGRAHDMGGKKVDIYYHWTMMERQNAEAIIQEGRVMRVTEAQIGERVANAWKECERVCEIGIERCGANQLLCYWAGYASCRLAKAQESAGNFAYAEGLYGRSIESYKQALSGREEDVSPVKKGSIWRGLAFAFDGLGDEVNLRKTLLEWYSVAGSDGYFDAECGRLIRKYTRLQEVPEFRYLLVLSPDF